MYTFVYSMKMCLPASLSTLCGRSFNVDSYAQSFQPFILAMLIPPDLFHCIPFQGSRLVYLFVGCSTSQQHSSLSQGRICSDICSCCHTETEAADPAFYLTQSQYTDTGPTSPSAAPITPGAWQSSHRSASFEVTGMTRPGTISTAQAGIEPLIFRSLGGRLNH